MCIIYFCATGKHMIILSIPFIKAFHEHEWQQTQEPAVSDTAVGAKLQFGGFG